MPSDKRKLGIDVLGAVPWGGHFCYFYSTKQDLVDVLVPYFQAGLENNESCLWITSPFLSQKEAEEALGKAVPDFARYLDRGQIEIVPHTEGYLKDGVFNIQTVLKALADKTAQALAQGYDGLRATGDASWLEKEALGRFIDYEAELNHRIGNLKMLAICTYSILNHGACRIIDVMSHHRYSFTKHNGNLTIIGGAELKQEEEKEETIIETALDGFWATQSKGKFLEVNDAYCKMIGYTREELLKMSIKDIEAAESPADVARHIQKIMAQGSDRFETRHKRKDGRIIDVEVNVTYLGTEEGRMFVFSRDITALKQAEAILGKALGAIPDRQLTALQERFTHTGFQGFNDQQVIELLLGLTLPPESAKKLAEECLEKFHSLHEFLAAPVPQLQRLGIPLNCILGLKLVHELPAHVLRNRIMEQPVYRSSRELFDYLHYSMRDLNKEVFKVIYLNKRSQIIDVEDLFVGTKNQIPISARGIIESALNRGVDYLVLVHNHTSGNPQPSKTDTIFTRDMVFVGILLQISILDHIIVGEDTYFSFAEAGLIQKYKDSFLNMKIKGILAAGRLYQRIKPTPHPLKANLPPTNYLGSLGEGETSSSPDHRQSRQGRR